MSIARTILTATTALTLSMGAGYAGGGNDAYLDQDGNNNSASIDQSLGSNNQAGRVGRYVTQFGDDNTISILQKGDQNKMGVTGNPYGEVTQTGSHNVLNATQDGFKNQTANVRQTSTLGLSGDANVATINQLRNYGGIGTLEQTTSVDSGGVMNTATLTQQGGNSNKIGTASQEFTGGSGDAGNVLTIFQNSQSNNVQVADQLGYANNMNISQGGGNQNWVVEASQTGHDNTVELSLSGLRNGYNGSGRPDALGAAGAYFAGTFADDSGATASVIEQSGNYNNVDYAATGNYNEYGFYQLGDYNNVGTITVTGNLNGLGVWQDSTGRAGGNTLDLGVVSGDGNDIGVKQTGENTAQIDLTNSSDNNRVWVSQNGDNTAASISIDGDSNLAMLEQDGINSADINITGDFNNNTPLTTWGGPASTTSGLSTVGLMTQNGIGNALTVNVTGSDNLWATAQDGPGNVILASVYGNGNQFGVSQTSTAVGHHTTVNQSGTGNNAGVSQ